MGDVFVVNEIEKIDGLKTDIGSMADGQNSSASLERAWDIGNGLVCEDGISISMYCEKGGTSTAYPVNVSYLYEFYEEA